MLTIEEWKKKSSEERKKLSEFVNSTYEGIRVPVIIFPYKSNETVTIEKQKYIVPSDFTFSRFVQTVRNQQQLDSRQALFFFAGNSIPQNAMTVEEVYNRYKDPDGFLYLVYTTENTFGA